MSIGTSAAIALGLGVAGIGGSVATGIIGSNAAKNATNAQVSAANHAADLQSQAAANALNFQKQQYGNSLNLLSPFYNTGVSANSRLAYLMGLNPAQGLPAGVINPNAPQGTNGGGGFSGGPGTVPRGGVNGGNFFNPRSLTSQPEGMFPGGAPDPNDLGAGGFNRFGQMAPNAGGNAGMLNPNGTTTQDFNPGNQVLNANGSPGTQPQTGANGPYQIQMRPPTFSGGTTSASGGAAGLLNPDGTTGAEFNPGSQNLALNQNPNVTNATTNQGGTGQVPQTGDPQFLGDGSIQQQLQGGGFGGAPGGDPGSFGSLAQGWNQTFQSPTNVTEQNDPGYQFRLQQGQQALQNSAAARGGLLTGGTAKALSDYNQNSASNEYGNVYNRALQNYNTNYNTFTNDQTNTFNRLQALSGGGQVSANNLNSAGLNFANSAGQIGIGAANAIGQDYQNIGAAQASGYNNGASATANAVNGGLASTMQLLKYLQQNGGGTSGGSSSGGWGAF
jgi:hypothetical protein